MRGTCGGAAHENTVIKTNGTNKQVTVRVIEDPSAGSEGEIK